MTLPPERGVISAVQALGMMTTGLPQDLRLSLALVSRIFAASISHRLPGFHNTPCISFVVVVGVVVVVSTYEHFINSTGILWQEGDQY